MTSEPFLTPAYKLTFSSQASGSGDVLGSAAGIVTAAGGGNGKVIDTTGEPQASTVVELVVTKDLDSPADAFTLAMGQVGSFRPARGDLVKIELGYANNGGLKLVMTGEVLKVDAGLTVRRLVGYSSARLLLGTFIEQHYEGKSAGAIVKDLASQAGVEVEKVEEGLALPAYVVDGRRSAYQHLHDLAGLCGFEVYFNPEGKLFFEKFVGGRTVHVFEFAKHILELDIFESRPRAGQVEAWGESPGGGRAAEAWAWLTKDFSALRGTAGSGEGKLLLERPALRTAEAARQAAQALFTSVQRRALRGRLLLTGQPQVQLGDSIRLSGLPEEAHNAAYQVRSITHRLTKAGGFTTRVEFRALVP